MISVEPYIWFLINIHSSDFDGRQSFTGKKRDAETGYYYHGARYYDPVTVTG